MKKNYFAALLVSFTVCLAANAGDAVFSNSDTENFNLQPLNYTSAPSTTAKTVTTKTTTQNKVIGSEIANKNYTGAINNLDNAEVELREQIANYTALMEQSKTAYEAKKAEYKGYKKQYKAIRKKLKNVEKSKKLIRNNYPAANTNN